MLFGSFCSAALFERIKSRRDPDSQSGMLALRAFSVGHFAAKLAWCFPISLSNPSRGKKRKKGTHQKVLSMREVLTNKGRTHISTVHVSISQVTNFSVNPLLLLSILVVL